MRHLPTRPRNRDRTGSWEVTGCGQQLRHRPRGVTAPVGGSIPAGDSSREFLLAAAPDATVVADHPVTVTASARDMRVTQTFKVTVEAP